MQGTYSRYYNFYFELCKRLHTKMKEDITRFKFRRTVGEPTEGDDAISSSDIATLIRRRAASTLRGKGRGGRR